MPPLLLEYLREPVQVVVQSLPDNEIWPIYLSALATLVGSFGGALLGGWAAYKGTKKVYLESERKAKLEKIYLELFSCRRKYIDLLKGVQHVADRDDYKATLSSRLHSLACEVTAEMNDILGALHISCPEYDIQIDEFFDAGKKFHISFSAMIEEMVTDKELASSTAKQAHSELNSALRVMQVILISLARILRPAP